MLASVAADGAISASGAITAATGIALQRNTPATTTDKLYNVAGALYFDGSEVGGGGGTSYTAGTGLTLVGTEFNTANTGRFDECRTYRRGMVFSPDDSWLKAACSIRAKYAQQRLLPIPMPMLYSLVLNAGSASNTWSTNGAIYIGKLCRNF